LTERNWHQDNWQLQKEVGDMKTTQAAQGAHISHQKQLIDALTVNQDRIYSKLDKLSGKLMVMVGIGIAIQALLYYILPGK
jgi:hypothetical protein